MEITKVVKPFIRRGVTQYFWQYSACVNCFNLTSLLAVSLNSEHSLDSWDTYSSLKQNYQPGSGSSTLGETTSSSQEMLISVICCVTAVEPLRDSALADEELFSVASMIWMAEDSEVGLIVTLLEAAGTEQTPSVNEMLKEQSVSPTWCSKSGNTYPLC